MANRSFAKQNIEFVKCQIIRARLEARKWETELAELEADLEEEIAQDGWKGE